MDGMSRKFEQFLKYRTTYSPRSLNISANWRSPWQSRAVSIWPFRGCLHDTGWVYKESFYRNNTKLHVSLRSYKPFWSVVAYRHACATRPSQLGHSSRTGTTLHDTAGTECGQISCRTNLSYQYENRSELVAPYDLYRCDDFVAVSCKRIQSYEWAPWWTQWWNLNKQNAIGPAEFSSFFKS